MPTETCVYHTVTLQPGEQFNLPPGAVLVGATGGLSSFDSTCEKPETLEEPLCYQMLFSLNVANSSSPNLEYNDNQTTSLGILGTEYVVANNNLPSLSTINAAIASAGMTGVITNVSLSIVPPGSSLRWEFVLYLKTIPSIADEINIHITGVGYTNLAADNDGLFVYPQVTTC